MNITGTMSYIEVEFDSKIVRIEGERTIGGFTAYKKSIQRWNRPYENIEINESTKEKIISDVEKFTKDSHMVISFI